LIRVIPQLIVNDIAKSRSFYEKRLGMSATLVDPPKSPKFITMEKDDATLFLITQDEDSPEPGKRGVGVRIYFEVDDAKALFEQFKNAGVKIIRDLRYNEHEDYTEFVAADPDGYEIGVYS
jgi:predicted enzyme related to lactoylglutathione lyase